MPENLGARPSVLTDAEREVLERPGLEERARAIVAVTELAVKLGLGKNAHALIVERLRASDGDDATISRQAFEDMSGVLDILGVDMSTHVVAKPSSATPSKGETDWLGGRVLDIRKVRSFYKAIESKTGGDWVSVPGSIAEMDVDEVIGLLALYGEDHDKPKVVTRQLDALREGLLVGGKSSNYINGVRFRATEKIAELLDSFDETIERPVRVPRAERSQSIDDVRQRIMDKLDSLVETDNDRPTYLIERVEAFLDALRKQGVDPVLTAEDFTHNTLRQLAAIYIETADTDSETIETNITCTWGWLAGLDPEDLRVMRAATKPGANAKDVQNSRDSFIRAVVRGWGSGLELDDESDEPDEYHAADLHLVSNTEPVVELEYTDETVSEEAIDEPMEEDEPEVKHERSLDEEPKHVQLAAKYAERLEMTVNTRAFEELLNPDARGEMTAAKVAILEILKQRVGMISADGGIINQLQVSARAKSAVRLFVGIGFVKNRQVVEHDPVPIKDQLRGVTGYDKQAYVDDFFAGLDALLDEISVPEEESKSSAPLQVVFSTDGKAQLG